MKHPEKLRYVMLVEENDGRALCFGPFSEEKVDALVENNKMAFPTAHVRSLPILSIVGSGFNKS